MDLLEICHKGNINGQSTKNFFCITGLLRLKLEFDSNMLSLELTIENGIGLGLRGITRELSSRFLLD
jgi:hypothetical protein